MRRGWVVLGAIIAIVGLLLAYLPLASTTSTSSSVGAGEEVVFSISSPLGTYGTQVDVFHPYIEVTVSWSSGGPVLVDVYACGSDANCTNASNSAPVASGNATSGSVSFRAQSGVYYAVLPHGGAQVTVDDVGPVAGGLPGMVLLVIGILVFVVGLVRKAPRPRTPREEIPEGESGDAGPELGEER
ncbi:MAG: hypothetical protein ACREDE_10540 [Thermoplasmata archaeon]